MRRTDVSAHRPLTQLVLKPTVYCYHRCPYCDLRQEYYADVINVSKSMQQTGELPKARPGQMPLELALHMIDEAAALGMRTLQLSGGDPLLYPHVVDLVRAGAAKPGVFVLMNSVGTGITHERAREIIDAGLGAWNFSVDTLDAALYAKLRGVRRGLPQILKAIDVVREAAAGRPGFYINYMTVITRHNFRELPHLIRHCLDTHVASVFLMNVYGDTTGEYLLTEPEIRDFRDVVVPDILAQFRAVRTPEVVMDNAVSVLGTFFSPDNSDANYARGVYWPDAESVRRACRMPDYYALVEADGRVLPCCLVEIAHEGEVGNVTQRSLTDVWHGDAYERFNRERIDFCQSCSSPRHKTLGLIPEMCRQFNA